MLLYLVQRIVLFIKMLNWRTGESTHRFDSINGDIYLTECAGDFPPYHADCFTVSQFIILLVLHGCAFASSMLHHLCLVAWVRRRCARNGTMESSFLAYARCDGKQNNRQCFSEGINGIIRNYSSIGKTGGMQAGRRDLLLLLWIQFNGKYLYGRRVEWAATLVGSK